MSATTKHVYFHNLDIIKGICILLVIIDHCGFALLPALDHLEVPAFFLISGFLYKYEPTRLMLLKKADRLLIPYLFFATLFYIPQAIDILVSGRHFDIVTDFALFYLKPANAPLWFLKSLFWVFIIYHIITATTKIAIKMQSALVLAISIAIGVASHYFMPQSHLFTMTGLPQALVALPLFAIGHQLKSTKYVSQISQSTNKTIIIGIISAIIWAFSAQKSIYLHIAQFDQMFILSYICSTAGFITLYSFMHFLPQAPILQYLGQNSLIIFGTHFIIISTLLNCGLDSKYWILAIAIATAFPISYLLSKYFPKLCGVKIPIKTDNK